MSITEKSMARKQLGSRARAAILQAAIVVAAALIHLGRPSPAHAANGECRWEGGSGAAGGHAYCKAEDCKGQGGLAECTKPIGAPQPPWTEAQLGAGNWVYQMCDEQPSHPSFTARWCISAGGQWVVSSGGNPSCIALPPDILGGAGTLTSNESRSVSISDSFAGYSCPFSVQDTGWGATIQSAYCGAGGSEYIGTLLVNEKRQRVYQYQCRSDLIISMYRSRLGACERTYKSRISSGQLQCYKPAESKCSLWGNPVAAFSGTKLQAEIDYRPSTPIGLEFVRHYNSAGHYRPSGITATGTGPAGMAVPTDYWRHTYDRRLYLVSGNAEVLAIAQRHDGTLRSFDNAGHQLENTNGGGDKLESVSGGIWKMTLADRSVERYDSGGHLQSITSPSGQVTTLTYGGNSLLSTVTGPFGHSLQLANDNKDRLATVTVPGNGTIQYGYDDQDRIVSVTFPDSTTRQYHYEDTQGRWLLTGITDENAQRFATYSYDSAGRVIISEHAGGAEHHQFAYGTSNTTAVTDPGGATRTLSFANAAGVYKPTASSLPGAGCGIVKQSAFDANGNTSSRTDFNDNQTQFTFDQARNLETSRVEAFGTPLARTITTQWHPDFRVPTQVDEPGRRTTYTYDSVGNVLTRTITNLATSQTRTWTYTYNASGQVLTVDGPRSDASDVTTFTYHECTYGAECGQVASVADAVGHTTTYLAYNAHGQPLSMTDPNNVAITLTYDSRQRLTSRDFGGELTSFTYYPTGLLKRVTLADSSYLEYSYDAAHRLTGVADGEGNRIAYVLDAAGNRTVESAYDSSQTLARTRGAVYDTLGRLLSEVDAGNNTLAHTYDLNGNMDGTVDQESRQTAFGYDELNRQTSVLDPMGGLVQYAYSARDELEGVTDPRSLVTTYEYNGFGDLTKVTSPDTGVTQYTRNSTGNIQQATDARSKTATYSYDAADRVTQITYSDQTIGFTYDQGTNGKGRLTHLTDASGSTYWTYTPQGRVATKQQVAGATTLTVSYGYNSAGQMSQITTPSGQSIGYSYTNGRPTAITVNGSPLLSNVLYTPFGPTGGWNWSNGTLSVREYDLDGRITTIDSAGLSTYQFNPDGTIQAWTDDSGALTGQSSGLTELDVDSGSNRLTSSTGVDARIYSYDAAGNITGDGSRSFTYNDAGRMVAATKASVTMTSAFNGLGQRVRKTTSGASAYFVYDEAGHLLGEYDNAGNLIQESVWFGDTPVAVLKPNGAGINLLYVHADHLNTPRRISRPSDNAVVWRWDSDPFGTSAANEDPDGDSNLFVYNLRFPGQYFDSETGLHYNYFRDYDPQVGRYVESDPIGLKGGINSYAYAEADPISLIDPLGLAVCNGKWIKFGEHVPTIPTGRQSVPLWRCACYWMCYPCRGPIAWDGNIFGLPSTKGVTYVDYSGARRPNIGSGGTRPTPKGPSGGGGGAMGGAYSCLCTQKPGPETGCNDGRCYPDSNFNTLGTY